MTPTEMTNIREAEIESARRLFDGALTEIEAGEDRCGRSALRSCAWASKLRPDWKARHRHGQSESAQPNSCGVACTSQALIGKPQCRSPFHKFRGHQRIAAQ